jgi:hypothetical protein
LPGHDTSFHVACRPLKYRLEEGYDTYPSYYWVGIPCRGQEAPQRTLPVMYAHVTLSARIQLK